MSGSAFVHTLPWAAVAVVAVLVVTFVVALRAGKHSVIDTAWGLLFAAIAVAAFVGSAGHGDPLRRLLLLGLPLVWGLRLAVHIGRRTIGAPEDPRYAKLLACGGTFYAVRTVYLLQGLLVFLVAAPVQVGMFEDGPVRVLGWVGVAVWAAGLYFEAVGDWQLQRFRQDPANRGRIIDVGLWRYTRHPNYFGDACVWWGIFLVAAERWPGVLTIAAPMLMTVLLTRGSGVRILEQHLRGRLGWDEYAARTSAFVPMPPRG